MHRENGVFTIMSVDGQVVATGIHGPYISKSVNRSRRGSVVTALSRGIPEPGNVKTTDLRISRRRVVH